MRIKQIQKKASVIAAGALICAFGLTGAEVATAAGPASAATSFGYCDGQNPGSYALHPVTVKDQSIFGRYIELRYDSNFGCTWARISTGNPGDEVWVDRTFDGGATWQGHLGDTHIPSGSRTTYTSMWDDSSARHGSAVYTRACGKAGDRPNIVCTGWF